MNFTLIGDTKNIYFGVGGAKSPPSTPVKRARSQTRNSAKSSVPEGEYYAEAVRWAAAMGVAEGTTKTTFEPNAKITREEMAAMFYRFIKANGGGFTGGWAFPLDYPDADKVSEWAYEPMCYLTMPSVGLMQGMEDGTLAPGANTNRAELATVLMRYNELD